jgi:hypothetical protein
MLGFTGPGTHRDRVSRPAPSRRTGTRQDHSHCLRTQHSRGHTCPRRTALAISRSATDRTSCGGGPHWPGEPLSASSDNNPDVQRLVLAGQQHIADIMDPETFSKHLLGFLHGPTLHREPCAIVEVEPPVIRAIANPDQDRPFTITSDQLRANLSTGTTVVPAARVWRRLARPVAEGTRWARRPDPPRFNAAMEGGFMGSARRRSARARRRCWPGARGGLTGLTGPEPSRSARGAHRQLSASAVGSTHQIVRRPEEGRLADYERGPEVARARLEQGRHSLRSDV